MKPGNSLCVIYAACSTRRSARMPGGGRGRGQAARERCPQPGSVAAGNARRAAGGRGERHSLQKSAYKEAVKNLAAGKTAAGFTVFERLGWVREVGDAERNRAIATDYMSVLEGGRRHSLFPQRTK